MQGAPTIPLDLMLYASLGVLGIGILFLLPIWWRNWRVSRGANLLITEADISHQLITRWLLLIGTLGVLSGVVMAASRALSFPLFMALCGVGGCGFIGIAFAIDAARARRH